MSALGRPTSAPVKTRPVSHERAQGKLPFGQPTGAARSAQSSLPKPKAAAGCGGSVGRMEVKMDRRVHVGKAGFDVNVHTHRVVPRASSAARLLAPQSRARTPPPPEDAETLFALSQLSFSPAKGGYGMAEPPPPLSPSEAARRDGVSAWLRQDVSRAIDAFTQALTHLEADDARGAAELLRLRAAALLRARRFAEALQDVQEALHDDSDVSDQGASDSVSAVEAERRLELQQMAAAALAGVGKRDEAVQLLADVIHARVQRHSAHTPEDARRYDALCAKFMQVAAAVPNAALRLKTYCDQAASASQSALGADRRARAGRHESVRAALGGESGGESGGARIDSRPGSAQLEAHHDALPPPVFRLVLRPRFLPWPLTIATGVSGDGTARAAFYCAGQQAPADPHLTFSLCTDSALVLLHARIDGLVEVLSNSASEAWRAVEERIFDQPPLLKTADDFEVLSSDWRRDGRSPHVFSAAAAKEWNMRNEGSGAEGQKREKEALSRERKAAELRKWLEELGMEHYGQKFISEGIYLDSMQYLQDEDLVQLGVTHVGERRKLMAVSKTQAQYKALSERLSSVETQRDRLVQAKAKADAAASKAVKEVAICKDEAEVLRGELRIEREKVHMLETLLAQQKARATEEARRATEAEEQAGCLAADSEMLQEHLSAITDLHRTAIRESRERVLARVSEVLSGMHAQDAHPLRKSTRRCETFFDASFPQEAQGAAVCPAAAVLSRVASGPGRGGAAATSESNKSVTIAKPACK